MLALVAVLDSFVLIDTAADFADNCMMNPEIKLCHSYCRIPKIKHQLIMVGSLEYTTISQ